ncbi:hypothetical protein LJC23_03795 [Desulfovibrio sp. OttesenSCG-928-I05]|nr:hypothetical protein [Desulfovibrio sp. OttesenSCG-928-I05]
MSFRFRGFFFLLLILTGSASTAFAGTGFLFSTAPQLRIVFAAETRGYLHPCAT